MTVTREMLDNTFARWVHTGLGSAALTETETYALDIGSTSYNRPYSVVSIDNVGARHVILSNVGMTRTEANKTLQTMITAWLMQRR